MKQFIKKILLFSLPIIVGLTIVFFTNAHREFCYNYIKGDCDTRGKLFYKRLEAKSVGVDYLFVGSSKTMNGINDGLIEDSLNKYSKNKLRLYNAGYCRFGRNLDFLLCKEFSKNNNLKKIFVEVRADESTTSHPMFAFLANSREILQGIPALNGKITSEIYNHSLMNLNYLRCILNLEKKEKNKYKLELHGYNNIDHVMEKELLEEFYKEELNKNKTIDKDALEYRYSRFYLSRIKKLCDKKNIELNFIFMPSFGNTTKSPAFKEEYEQWGKVIVGPDSIFNNKSYWKDVAHFNTAGATAFSNFLAKELAR